ncbi:MAG: flagellar basal-body rod protein FlgF [Thermovirgaceae bacterium]
MFRGIYDAASAMLVQQYGVDVTANNLANAETSGFKKQLAVAESHPEAVLVKTENGRWGSSRKTPLGETALGVVMSETATEVSPGPLQETENPLDCALTGDGFFQIIDEEGDIFYTRSGNFTLNDEGQLVTPSGMMVAGAGGPIVAGDAETVSIRDDGMVFADGEELGRFAVFRFAEPSFLHRRGENLFSETLASGPAEAVADEDIRVASGVVEGSNVNIVEEMTKMITASRAYEAVSKAFDSEAETARQMIQAFGR